MGFDLQKDDALEAARIASKPASAPTVTYQTGGLLPGQQAGIPVPGVGIPIIQPRSAYVAPKPSDVLVPNGGSATNNLSTTLNAPASVPPAFVTNPGIPEMAPGVPTPGIGNAPAGSAPAPTTTPPPTTTTTTPPKTTVPPHVEDRIDKVVSTNIPGTAGSNGSSFNYDSSQDPAYKQAALNLENQIVQSMVGRGGLYSSVTQQEVQNGLQNLEVQFREQRHSEWMAERDQVLQEAQFALQKSESEYSRWRDRQASASQATKDGLHNEYANLALERVRLDEAIGRYESGTLTSADASLLGFPGINAPRSIIESAIASKERAYQNKYAAYMTKLQASDNADAKLALADETRAGLAKDGQDFTDDQVFNGPTSSLGTTSQQSAYSKYLAGLITGKAQTNVNNILGVQSRLLTAKGESDARKELGDALYTRLIAELEKKLEYWQNKLEA